MNVLSSIQKLSKNIISSLPDYLPKRQSDEHLPINQFERRLEVGKNLLRKWDDASGSNAACSGVVYAILKTNKGGDINDALDAKDLLSFVSLSVTLLKEDEVRILSEALVCMGEARLALFSASITSSRKIKRDQLIYAKEIYVASVSVHICRSLSYCCRIESLTSSKHICL